MFRFLDLTFERLDLQKTGWKNLAGNFKTSSDSWELWNLLISTVLTIFGQKPVEINRINRYLSSQKVTSNRSATADYPMKMIFNFETVFCNLFSIPYSITSRDPGFLNCSRFQMAAHSSLFSTNFEFRFLRIKKIRVLQISPFSGQKGSFTYRFRWKQ